MIAANNRVKTPLDSDLLRQGRFDYVVNVFLPKLKQQKYEIQTKENFLLGITNSSEIYNHQEKEIVATHSAAKIIISQAKNTYFLSSVSLIPHSLDTILTLFVKEHNPNILLKETLT